MMPLKEEPYFDVLAAGRNDKQILCDCFLTLFDFSFPADSNFIDAWVPAQVNRIKELDEIIKRYNKLITL
jgi:hypothetical protein